jgi:alkylhydroperoxidase family enzyme
VLRLCEQMTYGNEVENSLRKTLVSDLGIRGYIELVAVIAGYNFCARMLNSLQVTIE